MSKLIRTWQAARQECPVNAGNSGDDSYKACSASHAKLGHQDGNTQSLQ